MASSRFSFAAGFTAAGKTRAGRIILAALALSCLPLPARAAADFPDYFDLAPEQLLNAQVVSASRKAQDVAQAPAAVYVITQEDIARSGMNSIPDLLRMVPGVDVAQTDSNSWAVSIRGFNNTLANKILVMIDGRTVYSPLFAGTFWEVQDLPLEDIERIEVVRGPGGTLWGANAVNGVINIITKNAKDTQGNLVSGGIGNYENGFTTAQHGGAIGQDGYYRVYAKYFDRGTFKSVDGGAGNDSWNNYRSGFRMDWGDEKSSTDIFSLHGDVYRTNTDELNTNYFLTPPYSSVNPETVKSDGANIMGLWERKLDDGASFKLQSFIDYSQRDEILLQDSRTMFDVDAQYDFAPMGRHAFTLGGNYRLTSDNIGGSELVTFDPASLTQNLFGLFGQDEITLAPDRWSLTLGSKLEHNDYTGFELEPSASLKWTPDARQTIWTTASRAVRTPSRIERDLNITNIIDPPGALGPLPAELVLTHNKNFGTEDLVAYEAGYRNRITPDLSMDATVFANDYTNLFDYDLSSPFVVNNGVDPIHEVFPLVAVNGESGEVYGFELAGSWNPRPNWKLSAGYSFLDMFLHAPTVAGLSQETAEGQSPQNQFNVRSYWNINDRWTLDTMAFYVDRLPDFQVHSYIRADANLGWKMNDHVQFNLVGQNLFNGAHREFGTPTDPNATEPGRSIFGKVIWRF